MRWQASRPTCQPPYDSFWLISNTLTIPDISQEKWTPPAFWCLSLLGDGYSTCEPNCLVETSGDFQVFLRPASHSLLSTRTPNTHVQKKTRPTHKISAFHQLKFQAHSRCSFFFICLLSSHDRSWGHTVSMLLSASAVSTCLRRCCAQRRCFAAMLRVRDGMPTGDHCSGR